MQQGSGPNRTSPSTATLPPGSGLPCSTRAGTGVRSSVFHARWSRPSSRKEPGQVVHAPPALNPASTTRADAVAVCDNSAPIGGSGARSARSTVQSPTSHGHRGSKSRTPLSRGRARQRAEDDLPRRHRPRRFLEIVGLVVARYGWRVLTYCLMSNHYHLLAQTPRANLARGMRPLNGVYAQSFNRRHGRDGHLPGALFGDPRSGGRAPPKRGPLHRAQPVAGGAVRAGRGVALVEPPGDDRHEPCRLPRDGRAALLLRREPARGARALPCPRRRERGLASASTSAPRRRRDFIARHLALLQPSLEHPRAAVRPPAPPLAELVRSSADPSALARAHREHGYSMRQIAVHLGCGVTTIHRRIRAYEEAQAA